MIIPCLNEEEPWGNRRPGLEGIRRSERSGEVVVVDNASPTRPRVAADPGGQSSCRRRAVATGGYLAGLRGARGIHLRGEARHVAISELTVVVERLDG